MVQGHTAGGGGPLSHSHECTVAISSSSLYCAHTTCQPWARCWDHQDSSIDMVLALMELAIWQERQTSKSHCRFKACYRREVQTAPENIGKGFLEKVIFGLRREGEGRHSDITVMGRSEGCVLGGGHSLCRQPRNRQLC